MTKQFRTVSKIFLMETIFELISETLVNTDWLKS